MLSACPQMYIFLFGFTEISVLGQKCPTGWFGAGCRFRCHCARSQTCNLYGQCSATEPCKSPYFGPGCQYVDLLLSESSSATPTFLRDNLHTTCNPNTRSTSVRMFLKKYLPFSWYRVTVRYNSSLFGLQTKVNNGTPCHSLTIYPVDVTVFDVWCHLGINVISVTIEGAIVAKICTVQISGGRNVALKQRTQQSSTYNSSGVARGGAENAVDGNTGQTYTAGSCTQTNFEASSPYWQLTFDRPYWLGRVIIYNRNDHSEWLAGFTLEAFNDRGNRSNWHRDTSSQHSLTYDLTLVQWSPVKTLRIGAASAGSHTPKALSLCEVQAMGDALCPLTTYGFSCEQKCHCNRNVKCNPVTGVCESTTHSACPLGTFGQLCGHPCSDHCQYNVCDAHSGHCRQCIPGYSGSVCDQACPAGTFGPACSLECSVNCAETCHFTTGVCPCKESFTGSLCSECSRGYYGTDCKTICPFLCEGHICYRRTGKCVSCIGRRLGVDCQDCVEGHYGALCEKKCPVGCANKTCDPISGVCHSCTAGFFGEYCANEVESNLLSLWLIPIVLPIIAVILCCWIAGAKPPPAPEESVRKMVSPTPVPVSPEDASQV